jgi:hypothetical protein
VAYGHLRLTIRSTWPGRSEQRRLAPLDHAARPGDGGGVRASVDNGVLKNRRSASRKPAITTGMRSRWRGCLAVSGLSCLGGVTGDPCTVPSAFTLLLFGELPHGGGTAATSRSAHLASPAGGGGPARSAAVAVAAGGRGAGRGAVRAARVRHWGWLQGAAAAGGSEPGRAGGADPARPRAGAGLGGGRPRRRAGRGRRRPPGGRPGGSRVCRAVARRQRRVAGRGPGRGGWRSAVCAGHRRSRVR